ncbi:HemX [Neisseria elongata subsp. glycolytica ATCC 29315]|uniref:HemX n=1 Tax=Neisseria elongata subsp. glycolytica ATCC 29315 TaxID=546263 RepID=D4DSQ7_NEIEG|nr:HemX [Neisseria elongata subsp. glycolytica ATCC 29315]
MSGQETEQAVNNGGENMENPKNTVSDGLQKDRPSESPSGGKTPPPRAEAEKTPEPPQAPAPVIIRESGGKGLAVGALVLSLLALGAGGFLFVQGQNVLKNQETAFNQKIDQAAVGESENAQILKENSRKQSELAAALLQIADGQRDNKEQIEAANRAYQELLRNRADWLVDETEATLNMAAQQLLLSGNVPVAVTVLENIESRLSRFEQADLLPIKQAVSSDLAALKNQPYLDISGTALRLDRLENAVAGMPLVLESTLQPGQAEAAPQEDPNASWWQRTWNKTLHGLGNLVEVRKLNNGDAMLLAPEQAYFVRENLRLRLLDARIALMQHNGEVFLSDLNNAEATVKQYFDNQSPATQAWLKELAELKSLDMRMVSNESLKASLAAVRNYQDTVRGTQSIRLPDLKSVVPAEVSASAPTEKPLPIPPLRHRRPPRLLKKRPPKPKGRMGKTRLTKQPNLPSIRLPSRPNPPKRLNPRSPPNQRQTKPPSRPNPQEIKLPSRAKRKAVRHEKPVVDYHPVCRRRRFVDCIHTVQRQRVFRRRRHAGAAGLDAVCAGTDFIRRPAVYRGATDGRTV